MDGIFIKVLPKLDAAAMAAVLSQMKSIFGGAGRDIGGGLAAATQEANRLQNAMILAGNAATAAGIKADALAYKAAAAAKVAEARGAAVGDAKSDSARLTALERETTALSAAEIAQRKANLARQESGQAGERAAAAEANHAKALENTAIAGGAAGAGMGKFGAVVTGITGLLGGEALAKATAWESQMTRIGSASNVTAGQLSILQTGLLDIGSKFGASMNELSDGARILQRSGGIFKDAANDLAAIKAAVQVSAMDQVPLSDVLQAVTASANNLHLNLAQTIDQLAKLKVMGGDFATGTLGDVARAVGKSEPTAAAFMGANQSTGTQLLTVLQRFSQAKMTPDASSDTFNNMLRSLGSPNNIQASYMGAMGVSPSSIGQMIQDPNGGLFKAVNTLMDAVKSRETMGPDGKAQISLPVHNINPDLLKNLGRARGAIQDPKAQELINAWIDDLANPLPDDKQRMLRTKIRQFQTTDPMFASFAPMFKKAEGVGPGISGNIDTQNLDPGMLIQRLFGTKLGMVGGEALAGTPQAQAETQAEYKRIQAGKAGPNGEIQGWNDVANTLSQKMKMLNSSLMQMAVTVGNQLLPPFKALVDEVTKAFHFLQQHPAVLHTILTTSEGIAAIWGASKILGIFSSAQSALLKLAGAATVVKTESAGAASSILTIGTASEKAASVGMAALGRLGGMLKGIGGGLGAATALGGAMQSGGPDWWKVGGGALMAGGMIPGPIGWASMGLGATVLGGEALWHHFHPGQAAPPGINPKGAGPNAASNDAWGQQQQLGAPTPFPPDESPDIPGGAYDPSILDDPAKGGKGGKKGGKGGLDAASLPGYLDPNGPDGTQGKPIYTKSADGSGAGGGNPFEEGYRKGSEKGGFLGGIVDMMTRFVANLALGNPYGAMMTQGNSGKVGGEIEAYDNALKAYAEHPTTENYNKLRFKQSRLPQGLSGAIGTGGPTGGLPTSGGSGGTSGGGPGLGPIGGTQGGDTVPLVQNPDGTWTSTDPTWAALIQRESGGQPGIENDSDSNWAAGDPSRGLFQFTRATWARAGGTKYGTDPGSATPQQQGEIAANLIKMNPSGGDWGEPRSSVETAPGLLAGLVGSSGMGLSNPKGPVGTSGDPVYVSQAGQDAQQGSQPSQGSSGKTWVPGVGDVDNNDPRAQKVKAWNDMLDGKGNNSPAAPSGGKNFYADWYPRSSDGSDLGNMQAHTNGKGPIASTGPEGRPWETRWAEPWFKNGTFNMAKENQYLGHALGSAGKGLNDKLRKNAEQGQGGMDWDDPLGSILRGIGGMVPHFSQGSGGPIGTDIIPAWLSPGETVLPANAMHFGVGGTVPDAPPPAPPPAPAPAPPPPPAPADGQGGLGPLGQPPKAGAPAATAPLTSPKPQGETPKVGAGPLPGPGDQRGPGMQPLATTQPQGTKDQPHGSTFGQGGVLGAAEQAGVMAAGAGSFGGGSMAAQIAMQEANLAASKIGDIAATLAVEMPLETFTLHGPEGQSGDLSQTLPFKLLGALAQSHPNAQNTAGSHGPTDTQTPENQRKGEGSTVKQQGQGPGKFVGLNIEEQHFHGNNNQAEMNAEQQRGIMGIPGGAFLSRGGTG
jgi:hypothetical protein